MAPARVRGPKGPEWDATASGQGADDVPEPLDDFADWVSPHLPCMLLLASRLVSVSANREDVVQEALTAAWRKRRTYDGSRGSPRAWLLGIVADQARKERRRRRSVRLVDVSVHTDQPADVDLERAIRVLPARQRLAVELHYFLDLPVAEVALGMRCSEGTVKATLAHARDRLRRELGEEFR